jgi:hypothetical protein
MKKRISIVAMTIFLPHFASAYTCTVDKYASESSKQKTTLAGPFQVEINGHLPDEGGKPIVVEQANWYVTRHDGMVSAELRTSANELVTISSTEEGSNIRVKAPGIKQILNCNAPGKTTFVVDPTAYNGEMMTTINPLFKRNLFKDPPGEKNR